MKGRTANRLLGVERFLMIAYILATMLWSCIQTLKVTKPEMPDIRMGSLTKGRIPLTRHDPTRPEQTPDQTWRRSNCETTSRTSCRHYSCDWLTPVKPKKKKNWPFITKMSEDVKLVLSCSALIRPIAIAGAADVHVLANMLIARNRRRQLHLVWVKNRPISGIELALECAN